MSEALKRLIELGERLPKHLRSDWDGTNHYELQSGEKDEFWWLILSDLFRKEIGFPDEEIPCDTEYGKRVGLIMDIAVALQESLPSLKEALAYKENVKEFNSVNEEYHNNLKHLETGLESFNSPGEVEEWERDWLNEVYALKQLKPEGYYDNEFLGVATYEKGILSAFEFGARPQEALNLWKLADGTVGCWYKLVKENPLFEDYKQRMVLALNQEGQ